MAFVRSLQCPCWQAAAKPVAAPSAGQNASSPAPELCSGGGGGAVAQTAAAALMVVVIRGSRAGSPITQSQASSAQLGTAVSGQHAQSPEDWAVTTLLGSSSRPKSRRQPPEVPSPTSSSESAACCAALHCGAASAHGASVGAGQPADP